MLLDKYRFCLPRHLKSGNPVSTGDRHVHHSMLHQVAARTISYYSMWHLGSGSSQAVG